MSTPTLRVLVLRVRDLEASKAFYEQVGFVFKREQHDRGPAHYSGRMGDALLELYPKQEDTGLRMTLNVGSCFDVLSRFFGGPESRILWTSCTLVDPDGNKVELVMHE